MVVCSIISNYIYGPFHGSSWPVGGWTGGEETRDLSIYAFISTNPSAISLAKAHNFIGFIWSNAVPFVICRVFLTVCIFGWNKKGGFGCHWNLFNPILPLHFCVKWLPRQVDLTLCVYLYVWRVWWVGRCIVVMVSVCLDCLVFNVE
jgi:hypothetical protein